MRLRPLRYVTEVHAVPEEGTVLHQMIRPDEPVHVRVLGRVVTVPRPNLPVERIVSARFSGYAVLVGPPWSILDRAVRCGSDSEAWQVRRELVSWLAAAARRKLEQAANPRVPGVMTYAIGVPFVPEGELWLGTRGIDRARCRLTREAVVVRFPIASSASLRLRVRVDSSRIGAWLNSTDLAVSRQGDSDGDLVFIVPVGSGEPDQVRIAPSLAEFVDLAPVDGMEDPPVQLDAESLAAGHAAKSWVGLLTWQTWLRARWNASSGQDFEKAWAEAYDRYLPGIEAAMDGRKTGRGIELEEFDLMPKGVGLRGLVSMARPGVRILVASRRGPIPWSESWRDLIRDYWHADWGPVGVDLDHDGGAK